MSKNVLAAIYMVAALAVTHPAGAQPVTSLDLVADRPAATLLLPNFQVDLNNVNGVTTLFSISNASATAVLAHVTVWSDLAVPVLNFNVYLTGYDVQAINMRDILNGIYPRTASDGQDPTDTISPQGQISQDINFASCNGQLPIDPQSAAFVAYTQAALTGQGSAFLGPLRCFGLNYGDGKARGFVTVDTVNNCTLRFPNDAGYFISGGSGDATNQNVLYGDYFQINPGANVARGDPLVHIVASATDPETSVPGEYTFYGRLVNWTAADNRQPLSTTFFARYYHGTALNGSTVLGVWRDPKVNQGNFTCGTRPGWYPLGQEGIVIFNEQEQVQQPPVCQVGPCVGTDLAPFGAATQRVEVGGASLPVPFSAGTLYLNLNTSVAQAGANPPEDPAAAQAWVEISTILSTFGTDGVGYRAIRLDSATNADHVTPN